MKIFDKILNIFKSKEEEPEELGHKPKEIKIAKKKVKGKKKKTRKQGNLS
jgi:hypothetical protein